MLYWINVYGFAKEGNELKQVHHSRMSGSYAETRATDTYRQSMKELFSDGLTFEQVRAQEDVVHELLEFFHKGSGKIEIRMSKEDEFQLVIEVRRII